MSDFLKKLEACSLPAEAKASLAKLYEVVGDTPALREAVSQAFQVHIEQTAEAAGVNLANDPGLKQIAEDYEQDAAVLMASFQATVKGQMEEAQKGIHGLQPNLDEAMAEKIRAELS